MPLNPFVYFKYVIEMMKLKQETLCRLCLTGNNLSRAC